MLGLLVPTNPAWVSAALADLDAVLVDHLHCELKAASNAMALVARHPDNLRLVRELTALAREELDHVAQVRERIELRGLWVPPPGEDAYAVRLRKAATSEGGRSEAGALADRLLVGALIEARSCERFDLLRRHVPDAGLRAWYDALFESEAGHFRVFSSLAEDAVGFEAARARLATLSAHEAEIVRSLPNVARVHG